MFTINIPLCILVSGSYPMDENLPRFLVLLSQHSKSKHHEVSFSGSLKAKLSAVNRIIGVRFTSREP